ncbi:hypothetical protein [Portibacter lacus]|uniref:Uncharacterized protein n=1 Tax=Portibacter lacus TaxID=1099794 RepID=A0AA37SWE3_9BACT|nr:hypothetical protein [Portibacter lacus]GLR18935.1 hypothetical protein GCM10007940_35510 [Portibacter lacus]
MSEEATKLDQLESELKKYRDVLVKAQDIIMNKDVSKYPIFVFHQHDIEVGIPIVEKNKAKGNWNINASSLEEFNSKSLIPSENVEKFQKAYKDTDTHICLFVISELGAQFIFLEQ